MHRLKVSRWKKIFHVNRNDNKKAWVAVMDFKTKVIKKDKEGHYIMMKEST